MEVELQSNNEHVEEKSAYVYSERDLALMMVEWRQEAQIAIAEFSVELTFANASYLEASLALIQFNQEHGIANADEAPLKITSKEDWDRYEALVEAVADRRSRAGQAGKNYNQGVADLALVSQAICDSREIDTYFEAYLQMPLNKPPLGGHIVGEYDTVEEQQ